MSRFASLVRVLAGVSSMRQTLAIVSIFLLGTGPAAPARAQKAAAAGSATFLVTGHGWGHGVGMSQYGAYGYAQKGFGYAKIVLHYFPGTELGDAPVSKVRVLLTSGVATLPVGSAADFRVRDATGAVHDVTAGKYTLTPALKLKVDGAATARALPGPLLFQPGPAPLQLKHLYRGSVQVDVVGSKLRAINVVGLEQYLYGVVPSEMPFSWAPEALKAQAVVARSYALATRRSGAFDLYPDTRSQVYLGVEHEKPSTTAAVDATAGQVVLYEGQVAKTFFFSTSGGRPVALRAHDDRRLRLARAAVRDRTRAFEHSAPAARRKHVEEPRNRQARQGRDRDVLDQAARDDALPARDRKGQCAAGACPGRAARALLRASDP